MEVHNTVADLRGSEKPDEMVILGAHLDSWDLGTGSTDNGTGSAAVLEAARALMKLNLRPRRTIRFVLFTGDGPSGALCLDDRGGSYSEGAGLPILRLRHREEDDADDSDRTQPNER